MEVAGPRDLITALFEHRMQLLAQRLTSGEIDIGEWQVEMRQEIRDAFAMQLRAGIEGTASMDDFLQLGTQIKSQDAYLEDFAHAIHDGSVTPDAISARAQLYARSSQQMYWRSATGDADLPAYPGDWSTPCGSNCGCEWVPNGDGSFRWVRGKDDSCEECKQREQNWQRVTPDNSMAIA